MHGEGARSGGGAGGGSGRGELVGEEEEVGDALSTPVLLDSTHGVFTKPRVTGWIGLQKPVWMGLPVYQKPLVGIQKIQDLGNFEPVSIHQILEYES
jgi:hypothetical protein